MGQHSNFRNYVGIKILRFKLVYIARIELYLKKKVMFALPNNLPHI